MSKDSTDRSMDDILLTKLCIPPLRAEGVPRPLLIERINQNLSGALTLLAAPPGYGKTSLLTAWAMHHPESVAWISLDEGDNDLARLLAYLIAALQRLQPDIGGSALAMLRSPKSLKTETILVPLLNDISTFDQDLFLVLDDYHVIGDPQIHQVFGYILDHIPARMHVLIASRSDPPMPLARLRGRGKLLELRAEDLKFSTEETNDFLVKTFGLRISEEDLNSLYLRTEGWITGLQMAALSLRDHEDPALFIRNFTGDDRLIVDYLVEEVLSNLSEEKRHFLSCTGFLNRLSSLLCDAVVYGDENAGKSRKMLASLESDHLFLVPLDNRRVWYRYHQLFADLLQKGMMQSQPDLIPELHRRASVWYEKHGYLHDAIAHTFESGDFNRAASLINRAAQDMLMHSQVITLRRWIERLPAGLSFPDPQLYIYDAITLLISGASQETVENRLQEVEQGSLQGHVQGELAALRAMVAMYRGEMDTCVELAEKALTLLPKNSHFLRSVTVDTLGIAYVMRGRMEDAVDILQEAVRVGQESRNILVAVGAMSNVAGLLMNSGEMKQAQELYTQALQMARDSKGNPLPIAGKVLMGLGEIAREQNDLQTAEQNVKQAIQLLQYLGEGGIVVAYLTLSRIYQAKRDVQSAFEMLERAQELAVQSVGTELDDILVSLQRARLNLSLGDLDQAVQWAQERNLDPETILDGRMGDGAYPASFVLMKLPEYTTLVRILIAQGRIEEAQAVLQFCSSIAEETNQLRRTMECLVLQMDLLQHKGKTDSALQVLEKALILAEKHGFFRVFLDEGKATIRLLYEALNRDILPEFTGKLLAAYTTTETLRPPHSIISGWNEGVVEPLSDRELEILELIAQGMSNQEIAQALVLSLSTVKWHTSNIYGKMGVKNRTQAVAKARLMGIVSTG